MICILISAADELVLLELQKLDLVFQKLDPVLIGIGLGCLDDEQEKQKDFHGWIVTSTVRVLLVWSSQRMREMDPAKGARMVRALSSRLMT
ncbi:MAG: hypothetical protein HC924_01360 [Synechococcaceae cyanobacterium SM2_3_2]|nr:hypothetical protein [Synechococcaceae cyanobacterium SM2_3_2]